MRHALVVNLYFQLCTKRMSLQKGLFLFNNFKTIHTIEEILVLLICTQYLKPFMEEF